MHRAVCLCNLPTKPSHAGDPGHISLRKVDSWTCSINKVEVGKLLIRPEVAEFSLDESARRKRMTALADQIRSAG